MSAPFDVLTALQQIADGEGDVELKALRVRAAVAELIKQNAQLVEMCDQLLLVNNSTLGRGAVRIQAAIIDRFQRKLEASRVALARAGGGK